MGSGGYRWRMENRICNLTNPSLHSRVERRTVTITIHNSQSLTADFHNAIHFPHKSEHTRGKFSCVTHLGGGKPTGGPPENTGGGLDMSGGGTERSTIPNSSRSNVSGRGASAVFGPPITC